MKGGGSVGVNRTDQYQGRYDPSTPLGGVGVYLVPQRLRILQQIRNFRSEKVFAISWASLIHVTQVQV